MQRVRVVVGSSFRTSRPHSASPSKVPLVISGTTIHTTQFNVLSSIGTRNSHTSAVPQQGSSPPKKSNRGRPPGQKSASATDKASVVVLGKSVVVGKKVRRQAAESSTTETTTSKPRRRSKKDAATTTTTTATAATSQSQQAPALPSRQQKTRNAEQSAPVPLSKKLSSKLDPDLAALWNGPKRNTLAIVVTSSLPMAFDIARVLGIQNRGGSLTKGFFGDLSKNITTVVTWCYSDLFELSQPVPENLGRKKFRPSFPRLPTKFELKRPKGDNYELQLEVARVLLSRAGSIICATEASATGELLFRDLLGELKIETRQYMRLWLKGRSDTAIREGFQNLVESQQLDSLYQTASTRRTVDWLFDNNIPDVVSNSYRRSGPMLYSSEAAVVAAQLKVQNAEGLQSNSLVEDTGHVRFSFGMWGVPMLKLITERFIQHYQAPHETKFEMHMECTFPGSSSPDKVIKMKWTHSDLDIGARSHHPTASLKAMDHSTAYIDNEEDMSAIMSDLSHIGRVVDFDLRITHLNPPPLFNLLTLVSDANKYYSLTAEQTIDSAMRLHDAKLISFPKTELTQLPPHTAPALELLLGYLAMTSRYSVLREFVKDLLPKLKADNTAVFNADMDGLQHHAIIPTVPDTAPKVFEDAYNKLTPPQQRVMDLIVVRLFESFMPYAIRQDADILMVNNHRHYFKAYSRHVTSEGWRKVHLVLKASVHKPPSSRRGPKRKLPLPFHPAEPQHASHEKAASSWEPIIVKPGDLVKCSVPATPHKFSPKPPPLFSDTSLLASVSNQVLGWGFGSHAQRLSTIKNLLSANLIQRDGTYFIPTRKGVSLVKLTQDDPFSSSQVLAGWEARISEASRAEQTTYEFGEYVKRVVAPILDRKVIWRPPVQSLYHSRKGDVSDLEKVVVEHSNCPKCRAHKSLRLDIYSQYCIEPTCNFILPRVIWLKLLGPDRLVRDYSIDLSSGERAALINGETIAVEPFRFSASILASTATPTRAELEAFAVGQANQEKVQGATLRLDSSNRYELVVVYRGESLYPPTTLPHAKVQDFIYTQPILADSSQQQRHHHASSKARGFVEYIAPASLASTISISALAEPPAKSPRVLELTSGDVNKLREQFMQQLERLDRQEKSLQERLAKTQKKKTKLKEAAAQLDTSVVDK